MIKVDFASERMIKVDFVSERMIKVDFVSMRNVTSRAAAGVRHIAITQVKGKTERMGNTHGWRVRENGREGEKE